MTDKPSSGNRWEPDSTQPIAATPESPASQTPGAETRAPEVPSSETLAPLPVGAAVADPPRTGWRRRVTGRRLGVLAVAVAVLLLGGLGGFALGHAVGGGGHGRPGRPVPGQLPGSTPGQRPGPGDGDGHRHGFGPGGTPPSEAPGQDGSGARSSSFTFHGAVGAGA